MGEYQQSYAGVGDMLRSAFMEAEMRARAEKVKTVAEAIAPVGKTSDGDKTPGSYKAAFSVDSGRRGGVHHDRAYGRVVNDDPNAFLIEWGTSDTPRFRVLGKALGAA